MKILYEFTAKKTVDVQKTEDTPEGKLTRIIKEEVPFRILLKKPNRAESQKADELYAKELHRCIKTGMLTEPLLVKYYANNGGIFSEEENKEYSALMILNANKQNEYTRARLLPDEDPKKQEKIDTITKEVADIYERLQAFKRAQQNLFDQTAEKKATDKAVVWLAAKLTYIVEGENEPKSMFEGEELEEFNAQLDAKEEAEDEFFLNVFERTLLFTMFWQAGTVRTKEQFAALEESINKQEEAPKTEETT